MPTQYQVFCTASNVPLTPAPIFDTRDEAVSYFISHATPSPNSGIVRSCDCIRTVARNRLVYSYGFVQRIFQYLDATRPPAPPAALDSVVTVENDARDEEQDDGGYDADDYDDYDGYENDECPSWCSSRHPAPVPAASWSCPETGTVYGWCNGCGDWNELSHYTRPYVVINGNSYCDPSAHGWYNCTECQSWVDEDETRTSQERNGIWCVSCWRDEYDRCGCGSCRTCRRRAETTPTECVTCGTVPEDLHLLTGARLCSCTTGVPVVSRTRTQMLATVNTPLHSVLRV